MEIYSEKYFINPAIENGIQAYNACKSGEHYSKMYKFEMLVIKILTIIYGENSIIFPYKIDNERAFKCNLLIYDLKDTDLKRFINMMQKYYDFMEEYKSEKMAVGIINEIERILIDMLKRRAKYKQYSSQEISMLDQIFASHLNYNEIKEYSSNSLFIKEYWLNTKENLTDTQIKMININPDLLSREEYAKYGYDIRTIACLSIEEISEINNSIQIEKEYGCRSGKKSLFQRMNISLSTGNGYVDKLMLCSIISTEIMLGIIIIMQLGGK